MKLAILSDIHGNYAALQEVLKDCRRLDVGRILVLGDFVGYYYQADKVMEALSSWTVCAIAGNHEVMWQQLRSNSRSMPEYLAKYGSGLSVSLEGMRREHSDYLLNLPTSSRITVAGKVFLLCHGSTSSIEQYVYQDCPLDTLKDCVTEGVDCVLLGHTHYPLMARCGETLILNPGSVGQARDLGGLASWLIYDDQNGVFSPRRTPYPVDDLIAEIRRRDPDNPKLWQILRRGQEGAGSTSCNPEPGNI